MYDDRRKTLHPHHHTVAMLVYDEPGVLSRIANMFMKRNFNINTLTVGPSTKKGISRMTITFYGDDKIYEQMVKQLNKLIDVVKVSDLPVDNSIIRELALIKIKTKTIDMQNQIMSYCQAYRANVVNMTQDNIVVEVVGKTDKIDSFIQLVSGVGISEVSRTGVTAMSRGHIDFEKIEK